MANSLNQLRLLADIISNGVDELGRHYATADVEFPSLDETFDPRKPNESRAVDPDVLQSSMMIVAAAHQLAASVRLPAITLWELSMGHHISSCMQAVTKGHITEILREGGPEGVHANAIAAYNGMDAGRVSRILRLLATHHIFRELRPDVWTNNRLSSVLDSHKTVSELLANPDKKYLGTSGVAALIERTTDELYKGAAGLPDLLIDPETTHCDDPAQSSVMRTFQPGTSYFKWLAAPGNEYRRSRFNMGMKGFSQLDDGDAVLRGFPWSTLPDGAKIVDVGGGLGSVSMTIAKQFPQFNFIIQDFSTSVEQGKDFWDANLPDAQKSGRVTFQAHDFFDPQPVIDADVFLLRMIIHDWGASYVIKILEQLHAAATPGETKLIIIDQITAHACVDTSEATQITGARSPAVPEPLLPNLGKANSLMYLSDLQMLTALQGEERTLRSHMQVTHEAGWKIVQVYRPPGSIHCHLVAEVISEKFENRP